MPLRALGKCLSLCMAFLGPVAALAQPAPSATVQQSVPVPTLADRAAQLPDLILGRLNYGDFFTPEFLAAVPAAQLKAINEGIVAQHGAPGSIERIEQKDAANATIHVRFAKSIAQIKMTVDAEQGGRVSGLLLAGFSTIDDSLSAIAREVQSLPGQTHFLVMPLGQGGAAPLVAHNADAPLAIGSTFKLYILAEIADQVRQRKLGWDRVTDIDRRSFSSKATENWPLGAPVTVHTLASWMISVSDNAATDMLLGVAGRERVGARMRGIGNSVVDRNLPFLNTVEAFALKASVNADVRSAFLAADEKEQSRLLRSAAPRLTLDAISSEMFVGKPLHIDTIEWFANAHDLVRLLNHFRGSDLAIARDIMAINPGIGRDSASRWGYLGYKGGSEAGVISMSFLLQAPSGAWFAVVGSWNNSAAPVDNGKFVDLMKRAVDQLAKDVADKR